MIEPKKTPTEKVIAMRAQGLTDNQIIQSLQHDGHSAQEVLNALEFADHKPAEQAPPMPMPPPMNPMQNAPQSMIPPPQQQGQSKPMQKDEEIEELIEAIIEEKWQSIEKDIDRLLEWKDSTDDQLIVMKNQVTDLKRNFEELQKAIIGKVGEYDKNILEVGSQLKAMEQVFSKVLPTFTENVAELSRITQRVKKS